MNRQAGAPIPLVRIAPGGGQEAVLRELAEEVPIALELNGVGYAVLMATPSEIDDLVNGFVVAERLLQWSDPIVTVEAHPIDDGIVARANLPTDRTGGLFDRVRHRASESSCGLCGIENIEQAMRPLPRVTSICAAPHSAVFDAVNALSAHQPLNARTGAVHAAALVSPRGEIRLVREDVGRHNAFDKLIGAMRRDRLEWDGGFALLTSRCSFELVEKAAIANCPMLVTVSAPTRLAMSRAAAAGLELYVLARPDAMLGPPR